MYAMQQIIQILDKLAPRELAESWDNVGLLIGDATASVEKVLCALDLNEKVVDEAIEMGAKAIVLHHPFIFKPLKQIDVQTTQGRIIQKVIKGDLNVFAMHTNFDIAKGGMNDYLAKQLQLSNVTVLQQTMVKSFVKVVVYVPKTHFEQVRDTMITWNPCKIGNYSGCTFATQGVGTFRPEEGANPYVGQVHTLEQVEEVKLEFMTYADKLDEMLKVLEQVHPYEEIAWDAFELKNMSEVEGLGRVGTCQEILLEELIEQVKKVFNVSYVRLVSEGNKKVSRVAICSGSGGSILGSAAKCADVYITGDIGFHEAQSALDAGLSIIDVGHYASENIGMKCIQNYLEEHLQGLEVMCSKVDGEVFQVI